MKYTNQVAGVAVGFDIKNDIALEEMKTLLLRRLELIYRDVERYEDEEITPEFGDSVISRLQALYQ